MRNRDVKFNSNNLDFSFLSKAHVMKWDLVHNQWDPYLNLGYNERPEVSNAWMTHSASDIDC